MTPAMASRQEAAPPERVTEGDAQYAIDLVDRICREVGPGVPGTPQERKRAEIVRRELERSLGPENVVGEEFTFAPAACLSAFPVSAAAMLLAAVLNAAIGRFSSAYPWITAVGAVTFSLSAPPCRSS